MCESCIRFPARSMCDIFATLFHAESSGVFCDRFGRINPFAYWLILLNHRFNLIASDNLGMFLAPIAMRLLHRYFVQNYLFDSMANHVY